MSGTLKYASDELADLGSHLEQLAGDLRTDGRLAHVDKYDVAETAVIDALGSFADDWENKREELANNVESVGNLASEAARTFGEADRDLARKAAEIFEQGSS
ncbi:hypothetical protein [Nocardioides donggukensis]|uniref:Uncharacterized protein n=1 Tax=Nocardioides donggukensis TaxID=2774019 RepID=A0A927K5W0_9ACTN|nr:hypothetical protein [Nocardioides donggukensis]MBD8870501.1 hypothetical protein [Nocardioides donggukensis]